MQDRGNAEYFIARAEQCLRLAEAIRQTANELEAMGNGLMAKAVEVDTNREKLTSKRKPAAS
jgi:hypothetical protein